jgi:hypothetical protein
MGKQYLGHPGTHLRIVGEQGRGLFFVFRFLKLTLQIVTSLPGKGKPPSLASVRLRISRTQTRRPHADGGVLPLSLRVPFAVDDSSAHSMYSNRMFAVAPVDR